MSYQKKPSNKKQINKKSSNNEKGGKTRKKESLQEAKRLVSEKKYKEAIKMLEYMLMGDPGNIKALFMLSKCLSEDRQFMNAEKYLQQIHELNPQDDSLRIAFLKLYKKWDKKRGTGILIAIDILKIMLEQGRSQEPEFLKISFDLFDLITIYDKKRFKDENHHPVLLQDITKAAASLFKDSNQAPNRLKQFFKFIDTMRFSGIMSSSQTTPILWELFPYITSSIEKDEIFYDIVQQCEMLGGGKEDVGDLLEKHYNDVKDLLSYTLFELKYNLFWDNLQLHIVKLANMMSKSTTTEAPYYNHLVFYVTEFVELINLGQTNFPQILSLNEESIFKLSELGAILEGTETDYDNDKLKKMDLGKKLLGIGEFDDLIVKEYLFMMERKKGSYFLVKRIILNRCLEEVLDEFTIRDVIERAREWVSSPDTPSTLKFDCFTFLMDCEDFLGLKIGKKGDTNSILANITSDGLTKAQHNIITLEKFWFELNEDHPSSINEAYTSYGHILSQIDASTDLLEYKKYERRMTVNQNRFELLRLLKEGDSGRLIAEESLLKLNTDGKINLIYQHNLVVLSLLNGKEDIAKGLLGKIVDSGNFIVDEIFSKVYLSLLPEDSKFMSQIEPLFDEKTWYTYLRGLYCYEKGQFPKSYNYLSITLKKIRFELERRKGFKQRLTQLINLPVLDSGRYSTKAVFSDTYILNNCPVLFMDRLTDIEAQRHINNLAYLIGVLNKFLLKPQIAISSLKDLIVRITKMKFSEAPAEIETPRYSQQFDTLASHLLSIADKNEIEVNVNALKKLSGEEEVIARLCYAEVAICYTYCSEHRSALINLFTYLNLGKESSPVVLFEVLNIVHRQFEESTQAALRPCILELINGFMQDAIDNIPEGGALSKDKQQSVFLIVYLMYQICNENEISEFYKRFNLDRRCSPESAEPGLSYNLNIMDPSGDRMSLIRKFSTIHQSWTYFFLKTPDTEATLPEKLGSLLITLNLNYDNQLIWSILARFLDSQGFQKASFQAINMSKVFKVQSEVRETEYMTLLWLRILKRAEHEARQRNVHPRIIQVLEENLFSICAQDTRFLAHTLKTEQNLLKEKFLNKTKKLDLTIESLRESIYNDYQHRRPHLMLKRISLYAIHVLRKISTEEQREELKFIISLFTGPYKEELMDLVDDMKDLLSASHEVIFFNNFMLTFVSLILQAMSGWDDPTISYFYWNNVLNGVMTLLLNQTETRDILRALIEGRTEIEGYSEDLAKVINFVICKKFRRNTPANGVLRSAKLALHTYPHNKYVREMANSVFLGEKLFEGVFEYSDTNDFNDGKLIKLFSTRNINDCNGLMTVNKVKNLYLQNHHIAGFRNLAEPIKSPATFPKSPEGCLTQHDLLDKVSRLENIRSKIISTIYPELADNGDAISARMVQLALVGETTREQRIHINYLAFLDCLLFYSSEAADDELLAQKYSQFLIQNTEINSIYFAPYLQMLYKKRNIEELEQWVQILSFKKMIPKMEYIVNYHVLLIKIQESLSDPDDTENIEIIEELFQYFQSECNYKTIKISAQIMESVYKKFISKELSEDTFKENLRKLGENQDEHVNRVITKFLN